MVANTVYGEKYVTMPTRHRWAANHDHLEVSYEWKHEAEWDHVSVKARSLAMEIGEGTEEEFITEHYWGYTPLGSRLTSEYQVEHPRWQTYPVVDYQVGVRFGALYGAEFGHLKDAIPDSVMLAEGSPIAVRPAKKLR